MASISSVSADLWSQLQQQQAMRNVERAEQSARSLRAQAHAAESNAERAKQSADVLKSKSIQAEGDARSARSSLVAFDSLGAVQAQASDLRKQIADVLVSEPLTAVSNIYGEQTGSLLNVTA